MSTTEKWRGKKCTFKTTNEYLFMKLIKMNEVEVHVLILINLKNNIQ